MVNIMLCCAAGMSTSLLVEKMKKEAEKQGIEANIWAVGANEAKANGAKADVVLLGPQVRYLEATVKKEVAPTPAQLIDMRSYGRMDGAAVLKQAMDLIEANKLWNPHMRIFLFYNSDRGEHDGNNIDYQ